MVKMICKTEGCERALLHTNTKGYCKPCLDSDPSIRKRLHKEKRLAEVAEKGGRICASASCEKILRVDCKSEYCKKCRELNVDGVGTRAKRLKPSRGGSLGPEIQYCKGCGGQLYKGNKLGYCKKCREANVDEVKTDYNRERRGGVKVRENCKGCGKLIQRQNKYGYCWHCRASNVDGIRSQVNASLEYRLRQWRKDHGIIITDEQAEYHWNLGHCQICGIEFNSQNQVQKKCLDHDHETGHYRGTICGACNTGLGKLGDNLPEILEKVFHYYVQYSKQQGHQPKVNLIR